MNFWSTGNIFKKFLLSFSFFTGKVMFKVCNTTFKQMVGNLLKTCSAKYIYYSANCYRIETMKKLLFSTGFHIWWHVFKNSPFPKKQYLIYWSNVLENMHRKNPYNLRKKNLVLFNFYFYKSWFSMKGNERN